jgi:Ca2+-binding RTX toxin-like protein
MVRGREGTITALGLTIAAVAVPGVSQAATVQVTVEGSTHSILVEGAAGEANTVTLAAVDVTHDPSTYSVSDSTAPLTAGPGCSGGGPPGSVATCELPHSVTPCYIRGCPPLPAITTVIQVNLNDGDDSLDSTAVPERDGGTGTFSVRAAGGAGADRFVDGPNHARFTPGQGSDSVTAGEGYDWLFASEGAADEADVYDLGPGQDTVDYGVASYPVSISLDDTANDGGAGEGDQVLGAEVAKGGAAGDLLIGSDALPVDELYGNGGDDEILGGSHYDLVEGGPGDDTIDGRAGTDHLFGDGVIGPDGDDRIRGGDGNDFVEGFNGRDRLSGGRGADQVIGSTSVSRDHEVDRLDCGPGRDRTAFVGTEDRARRCERVRLSSAVRPAWR